MGHWEKLIKNLVSLKSKKITFLICGNRDDIQLFVRLPKDFQAYFQNTFYTTFTTSDLVKSDRICLAGERVYLGLVKDSFFSGKKASGVLKTKEEFTKDASYLDPMTDIFAVFQNVDRESQLKIAFEYTFKLEEDELTKLFSFFGKVFSYLWRGGEKKKEENAETLALEQDLLMSIWYSIQTQDPYMKESLTGLLNSVFAPFLASGSFVKKEKAEWMPVSFAQAINVFHLPTKINFVKGLDYTVYRKLPYPTTIPTPENTAEKELTILGDTDYRGDKIRF